MRLDISTTRKKYFIQALTAIREMPDLDKLADQDLKVLAQLLYYNYLYKDIPEKLRWKLVFDYDIKMKICDSVGIKESSINNIFTRLRAAKIAVGKSIVNEYALRLTPDNPDIVFKFKIEDDGK